MGDRSTALHSEKFAKMNDFFPIKLVRSDGQNYDFADLRLQDVPGEALNEGEEIDRANKQKWEIVLGHFLKDQLAPNGEKKEYKLDGFPMGYELRYVRKVNDETRRDYYLHGHPLGARHKYRSPNEFFPHLLWLAGDSKDFHDCPCDFCIKLAEKMRLKGQGGAASKPGAASMPAVKQQAVARFSAPAATTTLPAAVYAALIPHSNNIFRTGEMVWYKTKAWRLGVIICINRPSAATGSPTVMEEDMVFTVAPVGHQSLGLETLHARWSDMRPFLTFSVPATTTPDLQGRAFGDVDWPDYVGRIRGAGPNEQSTMLQVVGLEVSKLAARAINDKFSVFNPTGNPADAVHGTSFLGMWMGAELVVVGDAVRTNYAVDSETGQSAVGIMLVREIGVVGQQQAVAVLRLRGDVYAMKRGSPDTPTVDSQRLAAYFREELADKNAIDQHRDWQWVRVERDVERGGEDVHGRAYVSKRLMGIVDPAEFERQRKEERQFMDSNACLNKRPHSGNGNFRGLCLSRQAALLETVSAVVSLPEGVKEGLPQ